jgi:RNA polymerase sigma-70 factor (ECF subfamily)
LRSQQNRVKLHLSIQKCSFSIREGGEAVSSRDRRLLRKLTTGQTRAYIQAVEQHYERIYAFLYRLAQHTALAEDLTQDTFAAAWRSLDRFEGRASFATWLHKIALNTYREYRRRDRLTADPIDEEGVAWPDPAPELIERLRTEELQRKVQQAVARLPEIYREVVILRCYQGLKYREVAELLGVPLGTIQHRLHVAFEKLRTALREEVEDCETAIVQRVPDL